MLYSKVSYYLLYPCYIAFHFYSEHYFTPSVKGESLIPWNVSCYRVYFFPTPVFSFLVIYLFYFYFFVSFTMLVFYIRNRFVANPIAGYWSCRSHFLQVLLEYPTPGVLQVLLTFLTNHSLLSVNTSLIKTKSDHLDLLIYLK